MMGLELGALVHSCNLQFSLQLRTCNVYQLLDAYKLLKHEHKFFNIQCLFVT